MGNKTKVHLANAENSRTIESTIPRDLADTMALEDGDVLKWDVDLLRGVKVLIVTKVDHFLGSDGLEDPRPTKKSK